MGHAHGGHGHHHGHHHDHASQNRKLLSFCLILTTVFMLAEIFGGLISGSLALLSDAGHMFNDALSLGMALLAVSLSGRSANALKTYGYKRLETLAAFANGVTLVVVALLIFKEGVMRLLKPTQVEAHAMLSIAVLGLIVNLVVFGLLLRNSGENLNMRGALLHVLGDLLGSVGAIVAALVIKYTGWVQADAMMSLLIAGLILSTSLRFLSETAHILMEGVPRELELEEVSESLKQLQGVKDVHDLHIWSLDGNAMLLTAHIQVHEMENVTEILNRARRLLEQDWKIQHCTLEPELEVCHINCNTGQLPHLSSVLPSAEAKS